MFGDVPLRLYIFFLPFCWGNGAFMTLHTFLPCLHNCFFWCRLTVPGPGAPGGSPARRQAARPGWGHAGSCRASEVCWLALNCSCWRWKSIRLYLPLLLLLSPFYSFPSFYLSIYLRSLPSCSPQRSASPLPSNLLMFPGRKAKGDTEKKQGRECNSSSKGVLED